MALLGAAHVHVTDHLAVLEADPAVQLVGIYPGDRSRPGDMTGAEGSPSLGMPTERHSHHGMTPLRLPTRRRAVSRLV